MGVGFALCLAVGSAAVGRDGPDAIAPVEAAHVLMVSRDTSDVVLFAFPDRLANEPLPNLPYVTVVVRGTEGLAVNTGGSFIRDDIGWSVADPKAADQKVGPIQGWLVTWTEGGTGYWLSSEHRELSDLVNLAGSLR